MIIAQQGNFTVIVTQEKDPSALRADPKGISSEEKKEEAEKKETVWDAANTVSVFYVKEIYIPANFSALISWTWNLLACRLCEWNCVEP